MTEEGSEENRTSKIEQTEKTMSTLVSLLDSLSPEEQDRLAESDLFTDLLSYLHAIWYESSDASRTSDQSEHEPVTETDISYTLPIDKLGPDLESSFSDSGSSSLD